MSDTNGNGGRIALLGDHRAPRPTKAEAEKQMADGIAKIAEATAIRVTEFYMQQFPGLVAAMLAQSLAEFAKQNGMTFEPPKPDTPTDAAAEST